jgi:hypothetical protein
MKMNLIYLLGLAIVCFLFANILWGTQSFTQLIVPTIALWLTVVIVYIISKKVSDRVWILAGLLTLAGLFLPVPMDGGIYPNGVPLAGLIDQNVPFLPILLPTLALFVAAMLIRTGLKQYNDRRIPGQDENKDGSVKPGYSGRTMAIAFVLSALLLIKLLHNLYWITVWDRTTDSIDYLWLLFPIPVALLSSAFLLYLLPGRHKAAGLYFLLIIPMMIFVSTLGQKINFRQLTEERAGLISQAIETYRTQEGRYPQDLQQLTPWIMLSIPEPVIINGLDWCYDGGKDFYRLGYVSRPHWSAPILIPETYRVVGNVTGLKPICEPEINAILEAKKDFYTVQEN